jgi:cytochrome oxidase Cu insertion factor (SCO1/SenC/PrrC family)
MKSKFTKYLINLINLCLIILLIIFYEPIKNSFVNKKIYGFETFIKIENYNLIDQNDIPITKDYLKSKCTFATFGYIGCSTTCITAMGNLVRLSKHLPKCNYHFITIDNETDDSIRLKKFIGPFESNFKALKSNSDEELRMILKNFEVQYSKSYLTKNPEFHHTSHTFFIDSNATIRIIYPNGYTNLNEIINDIKTLENQ